jgi:glycine oxidase
VIPDFLILGGGVIGLATAWSLRERGARVVVLDRAQPGAESSWAGAGILSPLLPWDYGDAVNRLAASSQARYPGWIASVRARASTDPEYRVTGMLALPTPSGCDTWSVRHEIAGSPIPDGIRRALSPDTAASLDEAIWLPDVAQVRNPRLLRALLEALAERGVKVHPSMPVDGLQLAGDRVRHIIAAGQDWRAQGYVMAAGAWSACLPGFPLDHLPIRPVRGQMLLYRAAPGRLPGIVYQDGRYLVPRADGHILVGSTLEDSGFDKSTTATARADLEVFIGRLLPDVAATEPIRQWAGLRPGSPGNVPIITRHPTLANLYINSGHFRYGVTLAPASAELLADIALGVSPAAMPNPYAWPSA